MPRFKITEVLKTYATVEVEANSLEDAKEMWLGDYLNFKFETDFDSGSETVTFEEIK